MVGSLMDRAPAQVRHQQGGGGVMVWAAIINDELVDVSYLLSLKCAG